MQASHIMEGRSACHHSDTTSASLVTQHSQQGRPCSRWPPETGQHTPGSGSSSPDACRQASHIMTGLSECHHPDNSASLHHSALTANEGHAVDCHLRLGSIHLALKKPRCMHACRLATSCQGSVHATTQPLPVQALSLSTHSRQGHAAGGQLRLTPTHLALKQP